MTLDWGAFALVFTVSVSATVVVVALVSVALLEISTRYRSTHPPSPHPRARHTALGIHRQDLVAAGCLLAAAALVLFGLWQLVGR